MLTKLLEMTRNSMPSCLWPPQCWDYTIGIPYRACLYRLISCLSPWVPFLFAVVEWGSHWAFNKFTFPVWNFIWFSFVYSSFSAETIHFHTVAIFMFQAYSSFFIKGFFIMAALRNHCQTVLTSLASCWYIHTYIYIFFFFEQICTCACGGLIVPKDSPTLCLRQAFSLAWGSVMKLGQLARKPQTCWVCQFHYCCFWCGDLPSLPDSGFFRGEQVQWHLGLRKEAVSGVRDPRLLQRDCAHTHARYARKLCTWGQPGRSAEEPAPERLPWMSRPWRMPYKVVVCDLVICSLTPPGLREAGEKAHPLECLQGWSHAMDGRGFWIHVMAEGMRRGKKKDLGMVGTSSGPVRAR